MKSEKQNLENLYAPLIEELIEFKNNKHQGMNPAVKIFIIFLCVITLFFLGIGDFGLAGAAFTVTALAYYSAIEAMEEEELENFNIETFLKKFVKIFSKGRSWNLRYLLSLPKPKNISNEEYNYMLEIVTGLRKSDIIMNDHIIGQKGDNTFYYYNFGYMSEYKNGSGLYYVYGGEGLVFNFSKPFDGYLYVMTDTLEKAGGFIGKGAQKAIQSSIPRGNDLITMDNPEFEKYFSVRGEDKILAHQILTHTFMENLVNLAKLHNVTTYIAFYKQCMFIALDTKHNKFELTLKKEVIDEIEKFHEELLNVLEIVETINLDKHEMNIHAK